MLFPFFLAASYLKENESGGSSCNSMLKETVDIGGPAIRSTETLISTVCKYVSYCFFDNNKQFCSLHNWFDHYFGTEDDPPKKKPAGIPLLFNVCESFSLLNLRL